MFKCRNIVFLLLLTVIVEQLDAAEKNINEDLCNVLIFSKDHGLKINPTKTSVILFGNRNARRNIIETIDIRVDDMKVNFSDEVKSLGVKFAIHIWTAKEGSCFGEVIGDQLAQYEEQENFSYSVESGNEAICERSNDSDGKSCRDTVAIPTPEVPTLEYCTIPLVDFGTVQNLLTSDVLPVGSKIPVNTIIEVNCLSGKPPDPNHSIICVGLNLWSLNLPKCLSVGSTCNGKSCNGTIAIPTLGSCTLPIVKYGSVNNFIQSSVLPERSEVSVGTVVEVKCSPNKKQDPEHSVFVCVGPNKWAPSEFPKCLSVCAPIVGTLENHLFVKCTDATGKESSCDAPYDGFRAKLECEPYYENSMSENPYRFCIDGSWDAPVSECIPGCGRKYAPSLIVGGEDVRKYHYPWTVGVYNSAKDFRCGGSLLNMKVVVSVAHCFSHDSSGKQLPAADFHVAAGKQFSTYDHPGDRYAQYSDVESIFIPEQYAGRDQNYIYDIAVVVLKKDLLPTIAVRPVCLDRSNAYESQQLQEGNVGAVTGWGFNFEAGNKSIVLKEQLATCYAAKKCRDIIEPSLQKFYTYDKLCVSLVNASETTCHSFSGNGLVFWNEQNKRFYIRGIVSVGSKRETNDCDPNIITLYTKLSIHMDFVAKYESMYRPKYI